MLNKLALSLESIAKNTKNPNYFEEFQNAICKIGDLKDPNSIAILTKYLQDDTEDIDLMWSIVHTIEIFDDSVYVEKILQIIPYLYESAPEWTTTIFLRIINSPKCREELTRQTQKSSDCTRKIIKDIAQEIKSEYPHNLIDIFND